MVFILDFLKMFSKQLVSCGQFLLEVVQMGLELIVQRAGDLNLVIAHNRQAE